MDNESVAMTLRQTYDRCVSVKAGTRKKACNEMIGLATVVRRLADAGGTSNTAPAVLREMAAACLAVSELVRLCDARAFADLMQKPHLVAATTRVAWALDA